MPPNEIPSRFTLAYCGVQLLPPYRASAQRHGRSSEEQESSQQSHRRKTLACRKGAEDGTPGAKRRER